LVAHPDTATRAIANATADPAAVCILRFVTMRCPPDGSCCAALI
jgi:hypothetical protein